jgi:hypothetical protein
MKIRGFMHLHILPPVACLALPYFSHYFIKHTILGKKVFEHAMCVSIFFAILSETFLNLRRILKDIVNLHWFLSKALFIFARF